MFYSPKQRILLQDTQLGTSVTPSNIHFHILEVTEGMRCELPMQASYRTIPEPQKRVTKNECKVNYHHYMIYMVVKAHS